MAPYDNDLYSRLFNSDALEKASGVAAAKRFIADIERSQVLLSSLQPKILETEKTVSLFADRIAEIASCAECLSVSERIRGLTSSHIESIANTSLSGAYSALSSMDFATKLVRDYSPDIASVIAGAASYAEIQKTAYGQILDLQNRVKQAYSRDRILYEKVEAAIEVSSPFLPDDIKQSCEESIIPEEQRKEKKLTMGTVISLIGVFIALLSLFHSLLPDPYLQKLTEQNQEIIELLKEDIEGESERDKALLGATLIVSDTLSDLCESLDNFEDTADVLDDEVDVSEDLNVTEHEDSDQSQGE